MRAGLFLISVALVLGLGVNAGAQKQTPADSFFTGVSPKDIKIVPVDVSKAMKPFNLNRPVRSPRPAPFVLSKILPKITLPSWLSKKAGPPKALTSFPNINPPAALNK